MTRVVCFWVVVVAAAFAGASINLVAQGSSSRDPIKRCDKSDTCVPTYASPLWSTSRTQMEQQSVGLPCL